MRFSVLGPVEVVTDAGPVSVAQPRHRALLAYLLLQSNGVVTVEQVTEALWGGAEPVTARTQIHVVVSGLRRALRERGFGEVVESVPGGYLLSVGPDDLDADTFHRHLADGHRAADRRAWQDVVRCGRSALDLWRGEPLAGVTAPYAQAVRYRLRERWLDVHELLAEARLAQGEQEELIPELDWLVREHPSRERLVCQLMLARYRAGRCGDALDTARWWRSLLVEQQGLDPGLAFVELERAILAADPVLAPVPVAVGGTVRASTPPGQLPADVADFVGRRTELGRLAAIGAAPGPSPIALVAGPAGAGTSALAVHWAHQNLRHFPDGQLYADLRGFSSGQPPTRPLVVLRRWLRALGGDGPSPLDVDEAAALFRSRVAGRRMLLLLDGAAGTDQVRPLLPGSPGCMTVVTSRNRMDSLVAAHGAQLVRVGPLDADDAVALLGRTVPDCRERTDPAEIGELARRCDHLPLALRVAAAHLVHRPQGTVREYLARMSAHGELAVLDRHDPVEGAVSAALGTSYRRLSPLARRLFDRLHLADDAPLTPAEATALRGPADSGDARRALDEIARLHLLEEERPDHYRMPGLVRSFSAGVGRSRAVRTTRSRRSGSCRWPGAPRCR